jgi:hypothetical protein
MRLKWPSYPKNGLTLAAKKNKFGGIKMLTACITGGGTGIGAEVMKIYKCVCPPDSFLDFGNKLRNLRIISFSLCKA